MFTLYRLVSTTIAVYRGKSSLLEYVAAGMTCGAGYKFSMGPRAMLAGGIVGMYWVIQHNRCIEMA